MWLLGTLKGKLPVRKREEVRMILQVLMGPYWCGLHHLLNIGESDSLNP